jgi:hypothetical protein
MFVPIREIWYSNISLCYFDPSKEDKALSVHNRVINHATSKITASGVADSFLALAQTNNGDDYKDRHYERRYLYLSHYCMTEIPTNTLN